MSEQVRRSLGAQIEELRESNRELFAHHRIKVGKGLMTAADAEYRRDTLTAALATMEWLQKHETAIRGWVASTKAEKDGGQDAADRLENER